MRNLILGYLFCLNDKSTIEKLSEEEIQIGRKSLMGCLVKLSEHFETLIESRTADILDNIVFDAIKIREKVNGFEQYLTGGETILDNCTRMCAEIVYYYLRQKYGVL
jgi:hypothetical protein